jgi:hypothetical protein
VRDATCGHGADVWVQLGQVRELPLPLGSQSRTSRARSAVGIRRRLPFVVHSSDQQPGGLETGYERTRAVVSLSARPTRTLKDLLSKSDKIVPVTLIPSALTAAARCNAMRRQGSPLACRMRPAASGVR